MSRWNGLVEAVSDHANPVVVKELRQAVQSRFVIAILLLFLLANVIGVCGYLSLNMQVQTSERAGLDLFHGLYVLLVSTCMLFVPAYAAVRMTMERNDSNMDLVFITTIPPAAIIRGKFWSAVALTTLIYSACLPFLALTFLLRGIDLPSIFFALGTAFLSTLSVSMFGIFVGSVPGGLLLRLILGGLLLYTGAAMITMTTIAGLGIAEAGVSFLSSSWEAWFAVGIGLLHGLLAWGLFYLLSVAAVSARSSNRMFPVRVYLTLCWLISLAAATAASWISKSSDFLSGWTILVMSSIYVLIPLVMSERESWSPRVRRTIPATRLSRMIAFIFYTGSAGGIIWCTLMAIATLSMSYYLTTAMKAFFTSSFSLVDSEILTLSQIFLYVWCYAMSGLFLRRMLIPNSQPLAGTVLGVLLLGLVGSAPLIVAYLMYGPYRRFEDLPDIFLIANPFMLSTRLHRTTGISNFLAIWAVIMLGLNYPWFKKQWRGFVRHQPQAEGTAVVTETAVINA